MIARSHIFELLEDVGRAATGGRIEVTIAERLEALGGAGSQATQLLAQELGVSRRQAQRIVARETGTGARETRGMGRKSRVGFREMNTRELRRAGARALRDRGLLVDDGSTFALCYDDEKQGRDREIRGDRVEIEDNEAWLDAFEAGADADARGDRSSAEAHYATMQALFTAAFLEAYGALGGGDFDVCDEDGGANLSYTPV